MDTISLLGSTMGLGFVSGLNLYVAVFAIGLAVRFGWIQSLPGMSNLDVLANPYVLITAGILFVIEFFADKIPWVDSIWDIVHTLIRPLGAAVVGASVIHSDDPATKAMIMLITGGVAFTSHSAKAGTRVMANHSPEPFTNIVLSLIEDGIALVGAWLTVVHPLIMLAIVLIFLVLFSWLSPKIFRLLRIEFIAALSLARKIWLSLTQSTDSPKADSASSGDALVEVMPEKHTLFWISKFDEHRPSFRVRCVAGKGVKRLRNSVGYLNHTHDGLIFLTRRFFRFRAHRISLGSIEDVRFRKGLLFDRVTWRTGSKYQTFLFFKHNLNHGHVFYKKLQKVNTTCQSITDSTSTMPYTAALAELSE